MTDDSRERREVISELFCLSEWLRTVAEADLNEIVADGGITAGMVIQQEARTVQIPRLARLVQQQCKPPVDEAVEAHFSSPADWVNSMDGVRPNDQFIALDRRLFEDCIRRALTNARASSEEPGL
jgi:hypothetical protein